MSQAPGAKASVPPRKNPAIRLAGLWIAVIGMIGVLLCGAYVLSLRPDTVAERQDAPPEIWQGPQPGEVAELFTQAQTHEERLKWISDPDRDGSWMKRFFTTGPGATERVVDLNPMGAASNEAAAFMRFHVIMNDGGGRFLCVIVTTEGAKVDFRSYARFGTVSWEDLLAGRSKIAEEVRVFIEPSSFYLRNYEDEQAWSSYIATTPDTEMPLYFYAPRGSVVDQALAGLNTGGRARVTLAIRAQGDDFRHRQFEITDCITYGWVK